MKKKLVALAAVLTMVWVSACGNKDAQAKYLSEITASDYVNLGEYKGLEVQMYQSEPEVTDDYLDGYLEYERQNNAVYEEVTDRGVEIGDVTNIDYVGKLDGVAFEGGTAQGYDLEIGSGAFIEGFETGMLGMKTGETRDVEATFPDPYENNPDLAGKTAVFTVTVNSINMLTVPEFTDEYVASLGVEGCATTEEYRKYAYDVLLDYKVQMYNQEKINLAVEMVSMNSEYKELPKTMIDRIYDSLLTNLTTYANAYGTEVGEYVAYNLGGEAADYEATVHTEAEARAKRYVTLQAIADAEGLNVTEEEMDAKLSEEAQTYGYETVDEYKANIDIEAYREYLMSEKVMDFLDENSVAIPTE